jgi:hypothetical protein
MSVENATLLGSWWTRSNESMPYQVSSVDWEYEQVRLAPDYGEPIVVSFTELLSKQWTKVGR